MYNLSDNSSGYGAVHGGSSYGGAAMGFSMPVAPAAVGGYGAAAPIILGGGNGGMFGGCGDGGILGLLAILAIAGRGNGGLFGGGNDGGGCAVPTLISDNINGRFGAISDQITGTAAAGIAATHNAAQLEATRDNGAAICGLRQEVATVGGIINTNLQAGFGAVALESCRDTSILNSNISEVKFAGALAELRTQGKISEVQYQMALQSKDYAMMLMECCCKLEAQAERNKCEIISNQNAGFMALSKQMSDYRYQDLEKENCRLYSKLDRQETIAALSPKPPVNAVPVSGSQPIFPTVISADAFCGFGNSSFRGNNNYGGGCGGYGNNC